MNLKKLGFNHHFEREFMNTKKEENWQPGRVAAEYKGYFKIIAEAGEYLGEISGKMRFNDQYPAVGDWVVFSEMGEDRAIIYSILKRQNKFSRTAAGRTGKEQIVAANIDLVFIVSSFNNDFNIKRLERYLTLVNHSGAEPVILINKIDLAEDQIFELPEYKKLERFKDKIDLITVSALEGTNMDKIKGKVIGNKTAAFLGSSGVGKSTIINYFLENRVQTVKAVREDDSRGRHTTTNREMFVLKDQGILIDTPGMREIQLLDDDRGFKETFSEIENLARNCKFSDCQHKSEPGCAIKAAISQGIISESQLENYFKLKREIIYKKIRKSRGSGAVEKYKIEQMMKNN